MKEFIEIPFGAKDSELCGWEYTIPEGFVASIENGKIIVKKEESEDERIKKAIIESLPKYGYLPQTSIKVEDAIAWLEKQGEQKHYSQMEKCINCQFIYTGYCNGTCILGKEKVEPKFKEGDWVVWDNKISCHVDNIYQGKNSLMYTITDTNNMTRSYSVKGFDNNAHLWTIQDAKDGDVICAYPNANHPWIGIFCKLNDEGTFNSHCYLQAGQHGQFCIPNEENIFGKRNAYNHSSKDVVPATKEQHDLLFKKMKEAGYEWDAEKKELKKIEQKSAWSEEDEIGLGDALWCCEQATSIAKDENDMCNAWYAEKWLKSLKERMKGE